MAGRWTALGGDGVAGPLNQPALRRSPRRLRNGYLLPGRPARPTRVGELPPPSGTTPAGTRGRAGTAARDGTGPSPHEISGLRAANTRGRAPPGLAGAATGHGAASALVLRQGSRTHLERDSEPGGSHRITSRRCWPPRTSCTKRRRRPGSKTAGKRESMAIPCPVPPPTGGDGQQTPLPEIARPASTVPPDPVAHSRQSAPSAAAPAAGTGPDQSEGGTCTGDVTDRRAGCRPSCHPGVSRPPRPERGYDKDRDCPACTLSSIG